MGRRKILEFLKHHRKYLTFPQSVCARQHISFSTRFEKFMSTHAVSRNKPQRVKKHFGSAQELHTFEKPNFLPAAINEDVRNYCSNSGKFICSTSRHQYHEETEAAVNNQILAEFNAAFAYLSMATYFGRSDVAMFGASQFFIQMFRDEIEHALTFINHQNLRGGHVKLCAITTVECSEWCSIHRALEVSLEMEKLIFDKLTDLMKISDKHNDANTHEVVSTYFIKEGMSSIAQLAGILTRANKLGSCGMAEFFLDKELLSVVTHGSTYTTGSTK